MGVMPESLLCPVCGAANPPDATACFACGWSPAPAGTAAAGSTPARRGPRAWLIAVLAAVVVLGVTVAVLLTNVIGVGRQTAEPRPAGGGVAPSPQLPASSAPTPGPSPSSSPTPEKRPPDYKALAATVKSGVLKVYATGCGDDGSRIGSAFLIKKDVAVASYASLAGAGVVVVKAGPETIPATVKSADPDHGVVILKLSRPADGHVFKITKSSWQADDPVGLVGYGAEKRKVSLITSSVITDDDAVEVGGTSISGLARIEAAGDLGISGAPTLAEDGRADGMVLTGPDLGSTMVVPGEAISAAVKGKGDLPEENCQYPTGPDTTVIDGSATAAVEKLFSTYFTAINTADYDTAYDQVLQDDEVLTYEQKAEGWRSTYDFDITVQDVSGSRAHVVFTSIFLPGNGPQSSLSCARWDLDYTLADQGDRLMIDTVTAHSGGDLWRKC